MSTRSAAAGGRAAGAEVLGYIDDAVAEFL